MLGFKSRKYDFLDVVFGIKQVGKIKGGRRGEERLRKREKWREERRREIKGKEKGRKGRRKHSNEEGLVEMKERVSLRYRNGMEPFPLDWVERNKDAPRFAMGELEQGNGQAANLEVDHECMECVGALFPWGSCLLCVRVHSVTSWNPEESGIEKNHLASAVGWYLLFLIFQILLKPCLGPGRNG